MSYFSSVLFHFSFHLFFSHTVHPDYILPFFEALDPQDFPHHLLQHITNGPDVGVGHHFDSGPRELVSSPVLSHHQGELYSIVPDSTQLTGICKGRYSFPSFRSSSQFFHTYNIRVSSMASPKQGVGCTLWSAATGEGQEHWGSSPSLKTSEATSSPNCHRN